MEKSKRYIFAALGILLLSGCGSPRYTAKPIEALTNQVDIVIINDEATREGFLETMESWLTEHHYQYTVQSEGEKHDLNKLTLEYEGHWTWDLALYLKRAEIKAFQHGQRVGEVDFKVPYTANPNKFGNAEKRIRFMMDALFGQITAEEATQKANSSSDG
ncbi:Sbal_3080 family lipoprotein [Shewanella surugensis]|uniref:Sbal_3080 family lipoprotein n=1 Tax=Shewanella surugensis TaxID=212020 RepID=A0ABT0L7M3_9GAMM|nr:Sbal_3080 family lipoprotein [Shewanella surugensis]MCL1123650.1 Sbal_3080 family lipoprotein [Shewanella surugensis]